MVVEARPWLDSAARRYPYSYALVDVETTGLDPTSDRIVQIAVAHVSSHGVLQRTWSTLLDPGCDPGPVKIHGLRREHLADVPRYPSVAAELGRLLSDRVLVAHNATFDWRFLAAESRRADHQLPVARRLCTLALSRHLDLPVASLSLPSVASHFGVAQARAHDAVDDMRVMAEVFLQLLIAAEQVELALPLIPCDPADAGRAYPARSPRPTCRWTYPDKWTPGEQLMQGMKVAVTGQTTLPREILSSRAADAGLDVMNTVSGRTSLLVANDPTFTSSKTRNAAKHGIPIVDEAAFTRLLQDVAAGVAKPESVSSAPPPAPADAIGTGTGVGGDTGAGNAAPVRRQDCGPLAGRCLLVLGGLHREAAETRARISALGGIAAVNLTARVSGVVALPGADKDRRWARINTLGVPTCDPATFEPVTADPDTATPVFAPPMDPPPVDEPHTAQPPTDQHPILPDSTLADDDATSDAPVVVLPRGGVMDLPADIRDWSVSVVWPSSTNDTPADVDVVAFLTDQDDQVRADADFVFYNAPASADGSVELTLDIANEALVDMRLDHIPDDVERIMVAATIPDGHTFGQIGPIEIVVRTDAGATHIRATLDAATTEQSLLLACIYRRHGWWRFRVVGQGHEYGLAELATNYGVSIDD